MRAKSVRFVEGNAFAQTSHLEGCKQIGRCMWRIWLLAPGRCHAQEVLTLGLLLGGLPQICCLAAKLRLNTNGTAIGKGSAPH